MTGQRSIMPLAEWGSTAPETIGLEPQPYLHLTIHGYVWTLGISCMCGAGRDARGRGRIKGRIQCKNPIPLQKLTTCHVGQCRGWGHTKKECRVQTERGTKTVTVGVWSWKRSHQSCVLGG